MTYRPAADSGAIRRRHRSSARSSSRSRAEFKSSWINTDAYDINAKVSENVGLVQIRRFCEPCWRIGSAVYQP